RVIWAAQAVPGAVAIRRRPVAVDPDLWPSGPVGLQIALRVPPETVRHPRPGFRDHELSHFPTHRFPVCIKNLGGHPEAGAGKGAGLTGLQDRAPYNPTRNLGASGVIDDRAAPLADMLEVPEVGIRGPRLAGRAEYAQGAAIVLMHGCVAMPHDGSNRWRGQSPERHAWP